MRQLIIQKNKQAIHTKEQWFQFAPPEGGEKQWAPLHSAHEFARYFELCDGFVPSAIDSFLDQLGIRSSYFDSEPERITSLCEHGFGKNGPRHHDLLMWSDEAVIGIEAKATETLDEYVTDKCKKDGVVHYAENQRKRYPGLCEKLLNRPIEECSSIRYQLLSATAGTLIEAERLGVGKAVVLVVLFKSEIVDEAHIQGTRQDIINFSEFLERQPNGSYRTPFMPDIELSLGFVVVPLQGAEAPLIERI